MDEKQLESEIKDYQDVARENKNVDVAALMMSALQQENANVVPSKQRKWAYVISLGVPPLGLLFALKYYFDTYDDGKAVAKMCVYLTIFAVIAFFIFGKLLLSSSGTSVNQIEQIKPSDVMQLSQ